MVKWDANDYSRHSAAQQQWASELIAKLSLTGKERVLDIGCGDGKITAAIAELLPDGLVVGTDISPEMISFAQQAFPRASHSNLSFAVMDASRMDYHEQFDVVFSNAALHWIVDHKPVIRGIANALVVGGRCLLQMGGKGNAQHIIETIKSGYCHQCWGKYFEDMEFPYGWYATEDYEPWLIQTGMKPIRVQLLHRDMTQQGAVGLASWIRTTWLPYTQRLPEEQRDEFVNAVVETYLRSYPLDEQGTAHVAMVRLEVEAVKPAS